MKDANRAWNLRVCRLRTLADFRSVCRQVLDLELVGRLRRFGFGTEDLWLEQNGTRRRRLELGVCELETWKTAWAQQGVGALVFAN